jgi:hypothetical protein
MVCHSCAWGLTFQCVCEGVQCQDLTFCQSLARNARNRRFGTGRQGGSDGELLLAAAFPRQEGELRLALRHHKAAGQLELDILAEPPGQVLPLPHGAHIHRQCAFQPGNLLRIHAHEPALHLHMQAAGIGGAAGMLAIVDAGDGDKKDCLPEQMTRRADWDKAPNVIAFGVTTVLGPGDSSTISPMGGPVQCWPSD